jgi:hypothetical protein
VPARGYEITKCDPREFIASGDYVVALVTIAGHARETPTVAQRTVDRPADMLVR